MRKHDLGADIRDVFDSRHVASPGLEQRVVDAIPWDETKREWAVFRPRFAGVFAAGLAVVLVIALAAPSILSRLGVLVPSSGGGEVAYSTAAVDGGSLFIIQRGPKDNVLLETGDGGRTWTRRLEFKGIYEGMLMFGSTGFVWSVDPHFVTCNGNCQPMAQPLILYRTADRGATWTQMTNPAFSVDDAYFLDGLHGWAVTSPNAVGMDQESLYATSDGGRSWTAAGNLPASRPNGYVYGVGAYRVTFSDTETGWYIGEKQLFTTRDGGATWNPAVFGTPAAVAGWTVSPTQPFFKGQDGIVGIGYRDPNGADNATATRVYFYVSSDGGRTWTDPRPAPASTSPVGDDWVPTYLDPSHVWLTSLSESGGDNVQLGPAVARSADGGKTWAVATHTPRILTMVFSDARHGYGLDVSGPANTNGFVATSDGGATWYRVSVPVFG